MSGYYVPRDQMLAYLASIGAPATVGKFHQDEPPDMGQRPGVLYLLDGEGDDTDGNVFTAMWIDEDGKGHYVFEDEQGVMAHGYDGDCDACGQWDYELVIDAGGRYLCERCVVSA